MFWPFNSGTSKEALFKAAKLGKVRSVEKALEAGVPVDAVGPDGRTALFIAAKHNRTAVIRKLINSGANPNLTRSKGKTPLFEAIQNRSLDAAKLLIRGGARLDITDDAGRTPYEFAEEIGRLHFLDFLRAETEKQKSLAEK